MIRRLDLGPACSLSFVALDLALTRSRVIENQEIAKKAPQMKAFDMLVAFGVPMLIGKCLILTFGARYANEPGEGWGYYLIGSLVFTGLMVFRFLWKYRNYED